jgi:hypothetical protein
MSRPGADGQSTADTCESASSETLCSVVVRVQAIRRARGQCIDAVTVAAAVADLGVDLAVEADGERALVSFRGRPLASFSPQGELLWRAPVQESQKRPDPASAEYKRGIARGRALIQMRSTIIAARYVGAFRAQRIARRGCQHRRAHSPRRRASRRSPKATRAGPDGDGEDGPGDQFDPHGRRGKWGEARWRACARIQADVAVDRRVRHLGDEGARRAVARFGSGRLDPSDGAPA